MVGMAVRDENRVDLFGGDSPQQLREGRVADVEQKAERVVLEKESAARLMRLGPCAGRTENGQSHPAMLPESRTMGRRATGVRPRIGGRPMPAPARVLLVFGRGVVRTGKGF